MAEAAPRIVIIGCGNVAWHLAKKFRSMNCVVTIYNHRVNLALEDFRKELKTNVHVGLHAIDEQASFYFICVADRFIEECAARIQPRSPRAVVVHTSGSASLDELGRRGHGTAVFYPLQTFTRGDEVQWHKVPIIIEADSEKTQEQVLKLASLFSREVHVRDYEQRLRLHLAAVMTNNFTNAMFVAARDILSEENGRSDFNLLLPLAAQTVEKVKKTEPLLAQTGPARRGDKKVMKKHLRLLKDSMLRELYKEMSALIAKQQKK